MIATQEIEVAGLKFLIRPGTSDRQSIKEVVEQRAYKRRWFAPEAGELWLDLGANIGSFAVWASSLGARVVGYEPHPENRDLAQRNMELNGFPGRSDHFIYEFAVVNDLAGPDTARLGLHSTDYGQWRHGLHKKRASGWLEVAAVQFSPVVGLFEPVGVKMDVEGEELPIILNCYGWGSVRKFVFEYHFDIHPEITKFREAIETLQKHFSRVEFGKMPEGETYNYYPPARIVFCTR